MRKHCIAIAALVSGCLLLVSCSTHAATDEEKQLLAAGPVMINPMPTFSQWTVDCTYTDVTKPGDNSQMQKLQKAAQTDPLLAKQLKDPQFLASLKDSRPKRIVITKTGDTRHEETVFISGDSEADWRIGNIEVSRATAAPQWEAKVKAGFAAKDFPELQWVSADNFTGVKAENGRKFLAFQEARHDTEGNDLGMATAYIDVDTRYPASYRFRTEVRQYTIQPPPVSPLAVPGEVAAASQALTVRIDKATPHLSAP
jgi:hypothetical protein